MSINIIETLLIILYCLVVLGIGFAAKGRMSTETSYYLADRGLGTFFAGMGRFAAVSSAFTFFGALGLGYTYGLPYLMSVGLGLTFGFLMTLFFIPEIRRSGAVSVSDFLSKRYRSKTIRIGSAVIALAIMFPALVAQLRGSSVLGESVICIPGPVAVVIATIVFTSYVLMGGLWAVSWTNMFQGVLLALFMIVPAIIALFTFDGLNLIRDASEIMPRYLSGSEDLSVWSHFGIAVTFTGSMVAFPAYFFWSFTTTSISSLRRSIVVTIAFGVLVYTSWIFVLGAAFLADPNLDNPDAVYFALIEGLGGNAVVMGLVGAAALSAIMSSTDGLLISSSSIVTKDIVGAMRPSQTFNHGVRAGRISTIVLAAGALAFSFYTPAIIGELISMGAALAGSAFLFPIALGIWWKRMNHIGAMAGMFGGFGTFVILYFFAPLPMNTPILWALAVSLTLSIAGSLLSKPASHEQAQFVTQLHNPLYKDDEDAGEYVES